MTSTDQTTRRLEWHTGDDPSLLTEALHWPGAAVDTGTGVLVVTAPAADPAASDEVVMGRLVPGRRRRPVFRQPQGHWTVDPDGRGTPLAFTDLLDVARLSPSARADVMALARG